MAKENTRKVIPVTIRLYADKQKQESQYREIIERLLVEGKDVPASVLRKFLSFYQFEKKSNEYPIKVSKLVALCMERFGDDAEYNIDGYKLSTSKEITEGSTEKQHYNLWKLLNITIFHLYTEIGDDATKEIRENIVPLTYSVITAYRSRYLNKKHQKFLSDYKCAVLTAYIVSVIVGKVSNKKNPTNHDLQDAIKYHIANLKKAQKP